MRTPVQGQGESLAGGVSIGAVMLVFSWATRGGIGWGDGLLLCVTGVYLGFLENDSDFRSASAHKGKHHKAVVLSAFFQSGVSMHSDVPPACASPCDEAHPEPLRQPTLFIEMKTNLVY